MKSHAVVITSAVDTDSWRRGVSTSARQHRVWLNVGTWCRLRHLRRGWRLSWRKAPAMLFGDLFKSHALCPLVVHTPDNHCDQFLCRTCIIHPSSRAFCCGNLKGTGVLPHSAVSLLFPHRLKKIVTMALFVKPFMIREHFCIPVLWFPAVNLWSTAIEAEAQRHMRTVAQAACSLVGEWGLTLHSLSVPLLWQAGPRALHWPENCSDTSRHYEPQMLPP